MRAAELGHHRHFGHLFIAVGLSVIAVLVLLFLAFFDRHEARAIELSERDIASAGAGEVELSEEYRRQPLTGAAPPG